MILLLYYYKYKWHPSAHCHRVVHWDQALLYHLRGLGAIPLQIGWFWLDYYPLSVWYSAPGYGLSAIVALASSCFAFPF